MSAHKQNAVLPLSDFRQAARLLRLNGKRLPL